MRGGRRGPKRADGRGQYRRGLATSVPRRSRRGSPAGLPRWVPATRGEQHDGDTQREQPLHANRRQSMVIEAPVAHRSTKRRSRDSEQLDESTGLLPSPVLAGSMRFRGSVALAALSAHKAEWVLWPEWVHRSASGPSPPTGSQTVGWPPFAQPATMSSRTDGPSGWGSSWRSRDRCALDERRHGEVLRMPRPAPGRRPRRARRGSGSRTRSTGAGPAPAAGQPGGALRAVVVLRCTRGRSSIFSATDGSATGCHRGSPFGMEMVGRTGPGSSRGPGQRQNRAPARRPRSGLGRSESR